MVNDAQLVERARAGSREAWGELVYRHRAKAYGWAAQVTHDAYLAEDVVQEALFKAFLHMEKLMDAARFIPWLQRIVRNQALMELRKGSRRRELSTADWELTAEKLRHGSVEQTAHLLAKALTRKKGDHDAAADNSASPEGATLRKETEQNIRSMLACLTPKERRIFEAYFFKQLTPQEIADSLQMKRNYVYVTLHRTKQKLQDEQLKARLALYLDGRRAEGRPASRDLGCPPVRWEENYHSFLTAAHGVLKFTDKSCLTMADVMGFTGHAFRISLLPDIGPSSSLMYDFGRINGEGMRLLGFDAHFVNGFGKNYVTPDMLADAFRIIHESIDRGVPVVGWNLDNYEFGLIYGYDDPQQLLYTCDISTNSGNKLPYARLGRRSANGTAISPELFVMALADRGDRLPTEDRFVNTNRDNLDEKRLFRQSFPLTLRIIVEHASGLEPASLDGVVYGLKAYDVWIRAFQQRTVDPLGNAYNLLLLTDARKFAVQFLAKSSVIDFERIYNYRFQRLLAKALIHYADSFESWVALRELFPFPDGGDPHDPATAAEAIRLLRHIRDEESQGIGILQGMLETITVHPGAFTERIGPPF